MYFLKDVSWVPFSQHHNFFEIKVTWGWTCPASPPLRTHQVCKMFLTVAENIFLFLSAFLFWGGGSLWIQECLTCSLTGLSLQVATAYSMLELTKGFQLDQTFLGPRSCFTCQKWFHRRCCSPWYVKNTYGLFEANVLMSIQSREEGQFLYWFDSRDGFEAYKLMEGWT